MNAFLLSFDCFLERVFEFIGLELSNIHEINSSIQREDQFDRIYQLLSEDGDLIVFDFILFFNKFYLSN